MKKTVHPLLLRALPLIAGVLTALSLYAQGGSAYEDFTSNPRNFGGICRVYEAPTEALTPIPKGFKPLYISMYSRHGSRYLHREDYYSDPFNALNRAATDGKLTPLGESVLERVRWMWDEARGRYGDYSPVATEEHRGIVERMWRHYPAIFKGKKVNVFARATGVPRVILSMAAGTERLKELNPKIHVLREASNAHRELMNEFPVLGREKIYPQCEEMIARKLDWDGIKERLFTDKTYADAIPGLDYAIWRLYMMDTNTLNLGYDFDFGDLFTTEDRYVLWEATNYLMYASGSASPYNLYTSVPSAWLLVDDIRRCAERAVGAGEPVSRSKVGVEDIAPQGHNPSIKPLGGYILDRPGRDTATPSSAATPGRDTPVRGLIRGVMPPDRCTPASAQTADAHRYSPVAADLRYGHDMYLIALVTLLGIYAPYETDPNAVAEQWRDWRIAPMAGNIQLVFFREKKRLFRKAGKEVLVKFLLNEREVTLGRCPKEVKDGEISYYTAPPEPKNGPYYRWSEVRDWLEALSAEAEEMTRIYANIADGAYTEESLPKGTKGVRYSLQ